MTNIESPFIHEVKKSQESGLGRELRHLKQNWSREGLPHNWYDLPKTGFMIKAQMDLLNSSAKDIWLQQTKEDIKGFKLEYLCEGLVFPLYYDTDIVNGRKRMTAPLYGNKLMVDTVSIEERKGAVKTTLADKIEPFLLTAPDGSIAVMTSPSGESGLKDESGRKIIFPDSQTYIWQKKGDGIVGFTIRTDFENKEHGELLKRLGAYELKDNASVEIYVENAACISSNEKKMDIKDVVDIMRDVRFDNSGGSLFAFEDRMWSEVYQDLERKDDLWQFDEKTKQMVEEFKDYVLSSGDMLSRRQVQEALAATVLRIAKFLRGNKKRINLNEYNIEERRRGSYGMVLEDVQSLPGCAGGGKKTDSISPRGINIRDYKFDQSGPCKMCGSDVLCGPCGVCESCNDEIDEKERLGQAA